MGIQNFAEHLKVFRKDGLVKKILKPGIIFHVHTKFTYVGDGGKYGGKFKYFRDLTMPQIMMMTSGLQICQGSQYNEKTLALLEATLTFKIDLTFYLVFLLNEKLAILYFRY